MKLCGGCKVEKPLTDFPYQMRKNGPRPRFRCKPCMRTYTNWSLKKIHYGVTQEMYQQMFSQQNGRCAICGKHQSAMKIALAIDHCHKTGEVRGLLCGPCNHGMGYLQDSAKNLLSAYRYLSSRKRKGSSNAE